MAKGEAKKTNTALDAARTQTTGFQSNFNNTMQTRGDDAYARNLAERNTLTSGYGDFARTGGMTPEQEARLRAAGAGGGGGYTAPSYSLQGNSGDELASYGSLMNGGGVNRYALPRLQEMSNARGGIADENYNAIQQGLKTMDEIWNDRDPRFYASIWTNGTPWRDADGGVLGRNFVDFHIGLIKPDGTILSNPADSYGGVNAVGDQGMVAARGGVVQTGFGVMKYLDPKANNMIWLTESRTDFQIFRYGEILLNFAEAAFELGKSGEALNAINQIRDRAGIAKLTAVDREKIHHERKVELAFENHRYWDLRRWRKAETSLTRSFSGMQYILDYATKKYKILIVNDVDGATTPPKFPAHTYYFPITKARIAQNQNLVENPGY